MDIDKERVREILSRAQSRENVARIAREKGALTIVDAVTSLAAHPVEIAGWGVDCCYSCTQKGVGAPSGLAPIVFSPRALERRVPCRSFYFDLNLLEDYWLRRIGPAHFSHINFRGTMRFGVEKFAAALIQRVPGQATRSGS